MIFYIANYPHILESAAAMTMSKFSKNRLSGIPGSRIYFLFFALFVTVVYFFTAAPGIRFWDTAELAASTTTLGISHAPGFPLYTILGRVASLISPGHPAYAVNLLSALFGSLSVLLFVLIYDYVDESKKFAGKFSASLIFAFSGALWMQSNRAEVYSLQIFLTELSLLCLLKYRTGSDFRFLAAAVYVWGLSAANHTAGALAFLPVLLLLIFTQNNRLNLPVGKLGLLFFAAAAALSIYLYLPVRSALNPAFNWDRISDFQSFLSVITARDFAFTVKFGGWLDFSNRLFLHWKILYANLPWFLPLLTFIGIWLLRNKLYLLILFFTGSAITLIRQELPYPDHLGYLLPVIFVCAIWTGAGINLLFTRFSILRNPVLKHLLSSIVIAGLAFILVMEFPAKFSEHHLRHNHWAEKLGADILTEPLPDSIVLFNDISSYFISRYLQEIGGLRNDCALLLPGMLNEFSASRDWYRAELTNRTNLQNIDTYRGNTTSVIAKIIENNRKRPVYLEYGEQFRPFYNYLKPAGLLFKLDLTQTDSTASHYLFPAKEEFGSDQTAAAAFAGRLFALGMYYSDRGETIRADSLFLKADNYASGSQK